MRERARFVGLAAYAIAGVSCGERSPTQPSPAPEQIVSETIAALREATAVLRRVTDRASAFAEAVPLKEVYGRLDASIRRLDEVKALARSDGSVRDELAAATQKHAAELLEAMAAWKSEDNRVRDDPEAASVLRGLFAVYGR